MPSGARAGKYSKHISKLCCRCGNEETDMHLFFLCPFARAAWFAKPWYVKIDQMINLNGSFTQTLSNFLNTHHPYGSIENIFTFLWCIWKARNDCLFNRKERQPTQILNMANAINHNLEMINVVQDALDKCFSTGTNNKKKRQQEVQSLDNIEQGQSLKTDLIITGSKIYTDAAWKTKKIPGSQRNISTGLGIFCDLHRQSIEEKILIQASTLSQAPSPLHAEAMGLSIAAQMVKKMGV
jgi:hypothetical protein